MRLELHQLYFKTTIELVIFFQTPLRKYSANLCMILEL